MRNDPIIEETRKIRDELAAKFNYDVHELGKYYLLQQKAEGRKVVKRPSKKEKEDKVA
jgi:hypothetical protein